MRVLVAAPGTTSALAAALRQRGVRVLAYLPDDALLVAATALRVGGLPGVRASLSWGPEQAVRQSLRELDGATVRGRFPGGAPVVVAVSDRAYLAGASMALTAAGARVQWRAGDGRPPQLGFRAPADRLDRVRAAIARLPGLVWAELQPGARLTNEASAWLCQSGSPGITPLFAEGLLGQGQVIGMMDTGIDADSCYFRDDAHGLPPVTDDSGTEVDTAQRKVLAVDFYWDREWPDPGPRDWDTYGHGTHVAGSAAGDAGVPGVYDGEDGMAPAARLVIQDGGFLSDDCADLPGLGCPVRPLGPVLEQAYAQGARIHSNSWGDEEEIRPYGRYTERTADVDRFVWEHPDLLPVFAAGNWGGRGDGSVISPATGKNVLAVGATLHGDVDPPCVAPFSSRGPTLDGRVKPDVVAPGTDVMSARDDFDVTTDNCGTLALSGTSMACPTAAGLAALVRQYFTDGFYPSGVADPAAARTPSAALLKAVLIASAVDLSELGCNAVEPVPSRDQGWGLVRLDRALAFPASDHRLVVRDVAAIFAGGVDEPEDLWLVMPRPGPLKVVLVWADYPASSAAETTLVNDLDLRVQGPDGTFLGNAFTAGRSVAGGTADRLNTVEVVRLPEASAGAWRITVDPHAIRMAPQGYALAIVAPLATRDLRETGEVTAER